MLFKKNKILQNILFPFYQKPKLQTLSPRYTTLISTKPSPIFSNYTTHICTRTILIHITNPSGWFVSISDTKLVVFFTLTTTAHTDLIQLLHKTQRHAAEPKPNMMYTHVTGRYRMIWLWQLRLTTNKD